MTNGAAAQPPLPIDLGPPNINPNAPQPLTFESTGQDDLSPCNVNSYPADRFILFSSFAPIPTVSIDPNDPDNTPAHLQALLSSLQAARTSRQGAAQVAIPDWAASLPPDFGILYLDQLRVRPAGTVIGEHVYTLALGPLEKLTLTQTTYTKKTVSVDSLTNSSQETDQEFSGSFSNELASNVQNEVQSQSQQKLSVDGKVGYGPVSVGVGYSSSTNQGSRNAQTQSTKQSQQVTQKVSTKAKMEHRIEFKTQTETGVEDVAQRVFQNPNTAHTLMLNFYKVFQRHEIYFERYGATMCWAPCLIDPGRAFRQPWMDKIAQKVLALQAVPTLVPGALKLAPAPILCYSDWIDVPFAQLMSGNGNDNLYGDNTVVGMNVQTQLQLPTGYVIDPTQPANAPAVPLGVSYVVEPGPLQCELDTNYIAQYSSFDTPGSYGKTNPDGTPRNVQWSIAVAGSTAGKYTKIDNAGDASSVTDANPVFGAPSQLAGAGLAGARPGQGLQWSDIPGEATATTEAAPSNPATGQTAGTTSPSAAASTGVVPVSWYVVIQSNGAHPHPDPTLPEYPFTRVRTVCNAIPSDATVAAYNANLSTWRQAEYQARLADLQQTSAAAQAALADGATFDPGQEICRQLLGRALDRTTIDDRTCAYLESWRDAFAWESVAYVMTPCWMNPLLDFYNPPPVQPPGGGLPLPQQEVSLTTLLQVLSGLQSGGSTAFPYASLVPPLWGNQPTTFATAASMQAFVPIRPGMEIVAAHLLTGGANYDAAVQTLAADLSDFQQQNFGTVIQPPPPQPLVQEAPTVLQLASWQEIMPTDGTFVDALLGDCMAADSYLVDQLQAQTALKTSQANVLSAQAAATAPTKSKVRQKIA